MYKRKSKGKIQIGIGIISCILLLFMAVGEIFSVYANYYILSNEKLLNELGFNSPFGFQYSIAFWSSVHIYGFISLLLYLIFLFKKKLSAIRIAFYLCLSYFIIVAFFNITTLSPEEQIRDLTMGAWIFNVVRWLPKYGVEIGLLLQGLLGVRKQSLKTGEVSELAKRIIKKRERNGWPLKG